MHRTSVDMQRDYIEQSIAWEFELVDYIWRCEIHATGEESLSALAATLARGEIRRCLQARALVRRLNHCSAEEIASALRQMRLYDHAQALLQGDWAAAGLLIE